MGLGTAFLGMLLIEGISFVILSPPSKVISLEGTSTDGAALARHDLKWEEGFCFPDSHWRLSAWVHIKENTVDSARLLQITGFSGGAPTTFYVTWTSNAAPNFSGHLVTGNVPAPTRQTNVWVYFSMGSIGGTSFGHVFLRGNSNNVFTVTWTEKMLVTRASSIMAPAEANPFYVSYM